MEVEEEAAGGEGEALPPGAKRRAYDNVSGKVSNRPWKAAFPRHSSLAGRPPADWDARMREKAQKKALQVSGCGGAGVAATAYACADPHRRAANGGARQGCGG